MTEDNHGLLCGFCGNSWNSEYHINEECININEDIDEVGDELK